MQVLIVDDDPVTRAVLEAQLSKWGYEISAANDGEPAWAMIQEIDGPLIAIVDWMMPGLSGPQFCQRVYNRDDAARFYLILFTSKSGMDDRTIGIVSGADAYVAKSLDFTQLRRQLDTGVRVLERRAYEAEAAQEGRRAG